MVDVDREMRKHEQTKVQLKNLEGQYQNVVFLLRRIYRDTFSIVQKLKSRPLKSVLKRDSSRSTDYKKFSDSINILNLSPDELQLFVDPNSNLFKILFLNIILDIPQLLENESPFGEHQQIENFEIELNNTAGMNATVLYDMLSSIIEERISLEKKTK